MNPTESLHYAIGEIIYAVASADGQVQREERSRLQELIETELQRHHYDYDITDIIFQLLDKQHRKPVESYEWGMNQLRANSHYLSPALKAAAIAMMEKIAEAFGGVTKEENALLLRFRVDIAPLVGDPVYYGK